MSHDSATAVSYAPPALPAVRKITFADPSDALAEGWEDFRQKPSHILFLGIIYPIIGLLLARLTFGYDVLPRSFRSLPALPCLGRSPQSGFTRSAASGSKASIRRGGAYSAFFAASRGGPFSLWARF